MGFGWLASAGRGGEAREATTWGAYLLGPHVGGARVKFRALFVFRKQGRAERRVGKVQQPQRLAGMDSAAGKLNALHAPVEVERWVAGDQRMVLWWWQPLRRSPATFP